MSHKKRQTPPSAIGVCRLHRLTASQNPCLQSLQLTNLQKVFLMLQTIIIKLYIVYYIL